MDYINYIRTKLGGITWLKNTLSPVNSYLRNRTLSKMNHNFRKNADSVFSDIHNILSSKAVFWPEFGTLLGIYRDGGFMKHDFDFDFGAFIEDADTIISALLDNGFIITHEFIGIDNPQIRECTLIYKDISIDFFFFIKNGTYDCFTFHPLEIHSNKKKNRYKIKPFKFPSFTLKKVEFKGISILMPEDTVTHLIYSYGKNFMIPDPNFKSIHKSFLQNTFAREIQH